MQRINHIMSTGYMHVQETLMDIKFMSLPAFI